MKKVLKKFELWEVNNDRIFFYKGQKFKLQSSKKEPPKPNTMRCIRLNEYNSYVETVFFHYKTVVEREVITYTEKEEERFKDFQDWEDARLWQDEQRTAYEQLWKDDEDKGWWDYEPKDMWDDE